jgi:hypothetical protein
MYTLTMKDAHAVSGGEGYPEEGPDGGGPIYPNIDPEPPTPKPTPVAGFSGPLPVEQTGAGCLSNSRYPQP